MKICIVGSQGFIGSNLTTTLMRSGHDISTVIRGEPMEFHGCETVFNVAGVTGGSGFAASDPLAMVGNNLRLALDVFDAAKAYGVKHIIAMSSTTGYPERTWPVKEGEFFDGRVAECYRNPGETRRFIEKLARMYPFATTFVRCAGAYGPGDDYDPHSSHVIGATIRKIAERQDPIICWGDGNDTRDGTHIDDLTRALVMLVGRTDIPAMNIGTGVPMSVNRMIDVLAKHAGYSPVVEHDLTKPKMIRSRVLDVSEARRRISWWAEIPMEVGIRSALDTYSAR